MLDLSRPALVVLVFLLGSFVLLRIVERLTKVTIGRFGYLSLKYVRLPAPEGIDVYLGSTAIRFHRPSIAKPTWVSLVIQNSVVTIDLEKYRVAKRKASTVEENSSVEENSTVQDKHGDDRIRKLAERVRTVTSHGISRWVQFVLLDTTVNVKDAGTIQLGLMSTRIAHRSKHGNRRLDDSNLEDDISAILKQEPLNKRGIELIAYFSGLRFQLQGESPFEVMDNAIFNVWSDFGGQYVFHDVGLSGKFGKVALVVEDMVKFMQRLPIAHAQSNTLEDSKQDSPISKKSLQSKLLRLSAILDIITETQIHFGFLKVSNLVDDVTPGGKPVTITATSKDIVIDLNRLSDQSPDFRMLFEPGAVAHQGLVSAISATLEIETQKRKAQIFTIPMITFASKTSSIGYFLRDRPSEYTGIERNHNVTNLNTVITSPSIDIHSDQIATLVALLHSRLQTSRTDNKESEPIDKLSLPKVNFSFSIHDPCVRVVLDDTEHTTLPPMIIGRLSSISIDALAVLDHDNYTLNSSSRMVSGRLYYHSPRNEEFPIMHTDDASLEFLCFMLPLSQGRTSVVINGLVMELSKPEIVDCLRRISDSLQTPQILPAKLMSPRKHNLHKPPLERLPKWLVVSTLKMRNFAILVSGVDAEVAPDTRGLKISMEELWLCSSIAEQHTSDFLNEEGCPPKLNRLLQDSIASIPDQEDKQLERHALIHLANLRAYTVDSGSVINRNEPLILLSSAAATLHQSVKHEQRSHHATVRIADILLGFSLFKVYAISQALQVLRNAFARKHSRTARDIQTAELVEADQSAPTYGPTTFDGKIPLVRLKLRLPLDEVQMLDLDHLHISKRTSTDPAVSLRYARLYTDSPAYPGQWDRILSVRDIHVSRETHTEKVDGHVIASRSLVVRSDALRIRIPNQFVFYQMLEGVINSAKTFAQIVHRFVTQTNDYIIAQHPKIPKALPRIRIKSRIMAVELEDDPFESRLGLIFRVGSSEQSMREARESAFDRKVFQLRQEQDQALNPRHSINENGSIRVPQLHDEQTRESSDSKTTTTSSKDDYTLERMKLLEHSSRAWIRRVQYALAFRHERMKELRLASWGKDELPQTAGRPEIIVDLPNRPPLFSVTFNGVDILLDKPSFPMKDLPDFVYRVGRGMPKSTQYGLVVPISLNWKMDEARVQIRDYPLPLLHVPPLHASQKSSIHAWQYTTDLVIGEEFPEPEAIRHVEVCVIPADTGRLGSPAFNVEVQRTATSVKTYAEMNVDLNSSLPTRVHWGTSMQPAISDIARIFETLSKPQQDPSPKLGFWDKIGLVMHTSVKLNWKRDGDMHVTIKGSRDPHVVMGNGAGLTKVFRGNVRWEIGVHPDSRRLIEVKCEEYMLAIPDFSRRSTNQDEPRSQPKIDAGNKSYPLHHYHLSRKEISFQKILMKLTGDVHWIAGLAFERHCDTQDCEHCKSNNECRIWDFKNHWDVKMRIPKYSILPSGELRDAFKGYRSHYIHGHISVTSRVAKGCDSGSGYNSIHLTPKTFAHFFDWIHSFSGNLSLPIRSGSLFPSIEGPKQKFGQHLMTLKYNLNLEPLYLSHIYKAVDLNDGGKVDMTGVKAKIDSFTLDLHQRKEERLVTNKELHTERKSSHMKIYRGQVDFMATDLRALTAEFEGNLSEDVHAENQQKDPMNEANNPRFEYAARLGDFDVSQKDIHWIDMDDFVELDSLLAEKSPKCRIIPLAYSPRFLYDRDTTQREGSDHDGGLQKVAIPGQRFGFEKTHLCSMITSEGKDVNEDFGHVQRELWNARHKAVVREMKDNQERMNDVQKELVKFPNSLAVDEQLGNLKDQQEILNASLKSIQGVLEDPGRYFKAEMADPKSMSDAEPQYSNGSDFLEHVRKEIEAFNNRFIVHNLELKWNNQLRNILIRYIQQVNQRRGFTYYMSQKAVRFLTDLVDEQMKKQVPMGKIDDEAIPGTSSSATTSKDPGEEVAPEVEKLIRQLLADKEHNFFVPDETTTDGDVSDVPSSEHDQPKTEEAFQLNENYESVDNYLFRLIAPQIQFQSEKNREAAVVLTATSMSMKILAIKDRSIAEDDVSALVQRRFSLSMNGAQFFYAQSARFHGAAANLLSHHCYGANGEYNWPPWIPLECIYDFNQIPVGCDRIVNRTSILAKYIKHNNLRIKKNEHMGSGTLSPNEVEDRTDSITVHFPKFNLSANSEQYYALFTIAMDLLLYSEPLQKERNEQIEKILLTADFSDLSGAPEMVSLLQQRIRKLNDFKAQFKLHAQRNDPQCVKDEWNVERKLVDFENELFFLMKSVATAEQKKEDRDHEVVAAMKYHLKADEILWHLMEGDKAFIDFGLSQASFMRTDNSDSSNYNTLEIEMMQGINLSANPVFSDLFAPYFGSDRTVVDARRSKMVRIYWYMLEAIGGISVCDHFEVNLFPLRLQMEHEVGKKMFAYVFPNKNAPKEDDTDSVSDHYSSSSSEDENSDNASSLNSNIPKKSSRPKKRSSILSFHALRHSASSSMLHKMASRSNLRPDDASQASRESDVGSTSHPNSSSVSINRVMSGNVVKSQKADTKKKTGSSDDLTAMLTRANKNMSLVYVKVPSVVLALSYKGAKAKNFTDVTDFVFKMPTIEYRNKTWSYLDLAEHLKREVIKAVLSHTGSLLRDKITHRRSAKRHQPSLARQLTSYRTFVPAEIGERRIEDVVEERHRAEATGSVPQSGMNGDGIGSGGAIPALQNRTSTAESSSLHNGNSEHTSHGLFNNAIGRHIQHLSHIARHRDGLTDDNDESTLKKTRLLLGKFIDKAK